MARSALVRSLMDDNPIIRTLAGLTGSPLVPVHDRMEGALCVLKPFKAGEELAPSIAGNLGWHTDCGLGGCPITCPAVNIGIHLDGAGEGSSRLWALAGSRGRSIHDALNKRGVDMKNAVPLDTQPGDVTVHFIGKTEYIRNKKATGRKKDEADIEALGDSPTP